MQGHFEFRAAHRTAGRHKCDRGSEFLSALPLTPVTARWIDTKWQRFAFGCPPLSKTESAQ